jgi:hypothetical protein
MLSPHLTAENAEIAEICDEILSGLSDLRGKNRAATPKRGTIKECDAKKAGPDDRPGRLPIHRQLVNWADWLLRKRRIDGGNHLGWGKGVEHRHRVVAGVGDVDAPPCRVYVDALGCIE